MRTQIAIVRQTYRDDGGAERFVSRLLSALGSQEINVTLITRRWHDASQNRHVHFLSCDPPHLGRLSREWRFAKAVQRTIRETPFDLVQTNERVPGCDIFRAGDGVHREWLAQKSRVQSMLGRIYSLLSPYHLYIKHTERKLLEHGRLSAVICNSKMVKTEILRDFKIDESKIHVIYNGIDTDYFHPRVKLHRGVMREQLGIAHDAPVFLFVGSGFDRKGLRAAIQAIAPLTDAHLVIVGNDKRSSKYLALATRIHCRDRIHFQGIVRDVRPFYGMADAFVLPTLYDPFPNVVLEAMGCQLPVITSTHCGAIDIIANDENGFVCDALDVDAIRARMRRLTSPNVAAKLGVAARETVESMTTERMQQELTALYQNLMEPTGE